MTKKENTVPLLCELCPKRPTFSDISHMLTHISSKGHLSHRFKLQIRAQSEIVAKVELDKYDDWYRQHGVDDLLSERLASKNDRQATKERRQRKKAANAALKKEQEATMIETPAIEPEPVEPVIELAATPAFRAPVPRMHLWPTSLPSTATQGDSQETEDTGYGSPSKVPNFSSFDESSFLDPRITGIKTPMRMSDKPSEGKTPMTNNNKSSQKQTPDSATLRGTKFPGMDLFDSATPEMKRARNQRKGPAVVAQMIAFSKEVEPLETSYNPDGSLRGQRHVFDPPSCDEESPEKKDSSPKKRRSRKPTLSDISTNAPRLRKARTPRGHSPAKRSVARPVPRLPPPIPNPLANFGNRFGLGFEEDEALKTTGARGKKRGFSVFQDAPEVSPGRTESPSDDHKIGVQGKGKLAERSTSDNSMAPPATRSATMPMAGQENSYFPASARRSVSAPQIYPGQYFYGSSFNPLYMPSPQATSFTFGDGPNGMYQPTKQEKNVSYNYFGNLGSAGHGYPYSHDGFPANFEISGNDMHHGM